MNEPKASSQILRRTIGMSWSAAQIPLAKVIISLQLLSIDQGTIRVLSRRNLLVRTSQPCYGFPLLLSSMVSHSLLALLASYNQTNRIIGPIVPVLTFKTDDEAVKKANDTNYGLGASVWCKDIHRANKIAKRLQAGSVWVNGHFELDPRVPFGGHKESGIGVEWGLPGLKSYCNSQTLYLKRE